MCDAEQTTLPVEQFSEAPEFSEVQADNINSAMESPVKETSFESDADSIIDLVSTEEKVEVPELLEEAKVAYEEEAPKAEVVFEAISEVKKLVEGMYTANSLFIEL